MSTPITKKHGPTVGPALSESAIWDAMQKPGADTRAEPLAQEERKALEKALRNLHRELRAMLSALPVEAQTASGLARYLDTERTTCQRAVSAAVQAFPGIALAAQLPGTRGLRLLVEAAGQRATEEPGSAWPLEQVRLAIDAYDATVRRLAGSRSRLLRRLATATAASRPAAPGPRVDGEQRARQALFEAAAELTGRYSQTWLAVHIFEPVNGALDAVQQTRAHGLIGHRARDNAVPLTFHVFGGLAQGEPEQPAELNRFFPLRASDDADVPAEILTEYSTTPLPIVRSKRPHELIVQMVDEHPDRPAAFDLVFGLTGLMRHPLHSPGRLEEVWAMINFPVRRLLMDVFLHRELARACIPSLDVHLWRPDFAEHEGERWQTRFATAPRVQLLGNDLSQARSDGYGRQVELIRALFAQRGLNPAEYVGFRCEEIYPIWRVGYRMCFDFGESNGAGR